MGAVASARRPVNACLGWGIAAVWLVLPAVVMAGPVAASVSRTVAVPWLDTWAAMRERDARAARAAVPVLQSFPRMRPTVELVPAAGAEPVTAAAPALAPLAALAPQSVGTNFPTINLQDQITAFSVISIPPDTMGAIGPAHFMEVINGSVAIYNRTNGTRLSHVTLTSFFTANFGGTNYPQNTAFDPRVLYDRRSGRWLASALERGEPLRSNNHVILAVSANSNPTGAWSKYLVALGEPISGSVTNFSDFQTLGTDDNGVYVAARIFPTAGSNAAKFAAIEKSALLAGGPVSVYYFSGIDDMFSTPMPAHNFDAVSSSGKSWFVASWPATFTGNDSAHVTYRSLTWSGATGSRTPSLSKTGTLTTATFGMTTNAPVLGSAPIDTSDHRLQMGVIRGNHLWTCRTIRVNAGGGSAGPDRHGCEWLEINLGGSKPSLVQRGVVFDPSASNPRHYYYPSIMVTGQGHAVMGFSGSRGTEYVGAYYTGRRAGDASGTMGSVVQIKAGEAAYERLDSQGRNRWGDYSYTSLDPNDDMSAWTIQEYAESVAANIWGTWVAQLRAPAPTLNDPGASAARGTTGVVLNLTGTGFYDPGSGFSSRLKIGLTGGSPNGVTNTAVTYFSPTSARLTFDLTSDASPGPRDIALTNPDGQSATVPGGFTVLGETADVAVTTVDSPDPVGVGDELTYLHSITNRGPQTAVSVVLTSSLPSAVSLVSAVPSQGSCSPTSSLVVCELGDLLNAAAASVSIAVTADNHGLLTNTVVVAADVTDSNVTNNTATAVTTALDPARMVVTPDSVSFGLLAVGQSTNATFGVINFGQETLTGSASTAAPFAVVGGSPFSVSGGFSKLVTVQFAPASEGVFSNVVVFSSNGGTSTNVVTGQGAAPPLAVFSAEPGSGEAPLLVTFADESTGTISNRFWSFGDGATLNTTSTNVTHTYASPGTNTVRLIASGPLGASTNTQAALVVAVQLAAPASLIATTLSSSQIKLEWTHLSEREFGFKIHRSTNGTDWVQIATTAAGLTTYTDRGLDRATPYLYRVMAYNDEGDSAPSNEAGADTADLAAPLDLVAHAQSSSLIRLNWTDISPNEFEYQIERQNNATGEWELLATVGANVTQYDDLAVTDGTTYFYRLRSANAAGPSDYSNFAHATATGSSVAPAAPSNLSAFARSISRVRLSWNDESDNEAGFEIWRATAADGPWTLVGTTGQGIPGYTDRKREPNATYYYQVRAYALPAGSSAPSNTASDNTGDNATPLDLSAVGSGTGSIQLSWTDISATEEGVRIKRRANPLDPWEVIAELGPDVTGYLDSATVAGGTYYYKLRGFAAAGRSDNSNVSSATPGGAVPLARSTAPAAAAVDAIARVSDSRAARAGNTAAISEPAAMAGPMSGVPVQLGPAQDHTDSGTEVIIHWPELAGDWIGAWTHGSIAEEVRFELSPGGIGEGIWELDGWVDHGAGGQALTGWLRAAVDGELAADLDLGDHWRRWTGQLVLDPATGQPLQLFLETEDDNGSKMKLEADSQSTVSGWSGRLSPPRR